MTETTGQQSPKGAELRGSAAAALARAGAAVGSAGVSRPRPGQLLIYRASARPVQWLVLDSRDLPRATVAVAPVDAFGLRAAADLAVREVATGDELSLRGGLEVSIPVECCSGMRLVGHVAEEGVRAARERRSGAVPPFASFEVESAADYVEWMEEVVRPAVRELEELGRSARAVSPAARPWAASGPWRRAAAAILLVGGGLAAGLGLAPYLAGPSGDIPSGAAIPDGLGEPTGSVFAPLSPAGGERAAGEPEPYRLAAGDRDYSLLLALRGSPLEGALELVFENLDDPGASFTAPALEPISVGGARYVSVAVPSRLLAVGRWRLTLAADSTAEPLRYDLVVE